jgi:hypothetical protein
MVCGLVPCVQILLKKSVPRAVIAAAAGPLKSGNPELLYVFWVPARPTFADLVGMTCGPLCDAITTRRIFSHSLPQHFFGDFPALVSEIQPFLAIDIEVVNPGLRRHAGHASNVCPTTGPAR